MALQDILGQIGDMAGNAVEGAQDALGNVTEGVDLGGIVEGAVTGAKELDAIADLPSRDVLIARLLGSMMSPISGLAIVLDQIAKKMGGDAPAAAAAE